MRYASGRWVILPNDSDLARHSEARHALSNGVMGYGVEVGFEHVEQRQHARMIPRNFEKSGVRACTDNPGHGFVGYGSGSFPSPLFAESLRQPVFPSRSLKGMFSKGLTAGSKLSMAASCGGAKVGATRTKIRTGWRSVAQEQWR